MTKIGILGGGCSDVVSRKLGHYINNAYMFSSNFTLGSYVGMSGMGAVVG